MYTKMKKPKHLVLKQLMPTKGNQRNSREAWEHFGVGGLVIPQSIRTQ